MEKAKVFDEVPGKGAKSKAKSSTMQSMESQTGTAQNQEARRLLSIGCQEQRKKSKATRKAKRRLLKRRRRKNTWKKQFEKRKDERWKENNGCLDIVKNLPVGTEAQLEPIATAVMPVATFRSTLSRIEPRQERAP